MQYYSFETDMSAKDFGAIILRRKKKCPECGSSLERTFNKKYVGETWDNAGSNTKITIAKVKNYKWSITYSCKDCAKDYEPKVFW